MAGGVTDRQAARRKDSQAAVVVGGDPNLDPGSAGHGAQLGASVVEGENLLPGQALASRPVRAVLGHAPAVTPAGTVNGELCRPCRSPVRLGRKRGQHCRHADHRKSQRGLSIECLRRLSAAASEPSGLRRLFGPPGPAWAHTTMPVPQVVNVVVRTPTMSGLTPTMVWPIGARRWVSVRRGAD